MLCKNCQKEIESDYIACPFCGTKIQQQQVSRENDISLGNSGGAIGLLIAIAGVVCVIFTLWFLVKMGDSPSADTYSFGTSFVTIVLFISIIVAGVIMVLTGLQVMADGIEPHKIKVFGVAIMAVGIIAFYAKAFALGLIIMLVGIGIWKINKQ